jgi:hypothetical protein
MITHLTDLWDEGFSVNRTRLEDRTRLIGQPMRTALEMIQGRSGLYLNFRGVQLCQRLEIKKWGTKNPVDWCLASSLERVSSVKESYMCLSTLKLCLSLPGFAIRKLPTKRP